MEVPVIREAQEALAVLGMDVVIGKVMECSGDVPVCAPLPPVIRQRLDDFQCLVLRVEVPDSLEHQQDVAQDIVEMMSALVLDGLVEADVVELCAMDVVMTDACDRPEVDAHVLAVVDIRHRLGPAALDCLVGEAAELPVHGIIRGLQEVVAVRHCLRAHALQCLEVRLVDLQELQVDRIVVDNADGCRLIDVDESGLAEQQGLLHRLKLHTALTAVCVAVSAGKGTAVIEALQFLAADIPQELGLLLCLDALGERVDAEFLGHAYDRGHDGAALLREGMEERHVELERVEAVVLEHVERGIAAAEVVEPDLAAFLLEMAQSPAYGIVLEHECIFCDLQAEEMAGQLIAVQDVLQECHGIEELEVDS